MSGHGEKSTRTFFHSLLAVVTGLVGLIYLLNPTAGIIELIPDNIPLIGNLDEAAAVVLLLGALRYFGVDLLEKFRRGKRIDQEND